MCVYCARVKRIVIKGNSTVSMDHMDGSLPGTNVPPVTNEPVLGVPRADATLPGTSPLGTSPPSAAGVGPTMPGGMMPPMEASDVAFPEVSGRRHTPSALEAPQSESIEFRVTRGNASVRRLRLTGNRYTFGNAEGCSIRLSDRLLRPMHAVLIRDGDRVVVRAYSVPVEVNDSRVTESILVVGDRLRLGEYEFELLSIVSSGPAISPSVDKLRVSHSANHHASPNDRPFPRQQSVSATPTRQSNFPGVRQAFSSPHESFLPSSGTAGFDRLEFRDNGPGLDQDEAVWRQRLRREIDQWRNRQMECDEREQRCDDREAHLRGRESELWARAESLYRREAQIQSQESAVHQLHDEYALRQQELIRLRDEARQQQEILGQREAEFASQELEYQKKLEETASQLLQSQSHAEAATEAVRQMREQFDTLNKQIDSLSSQQQDLQEHEGRQREEHQRLRGELEQQRDQAIDAQAESEARRREAESRIEEMQQQLETLRNATDETSATDSIKLAESEKTIEQLRDQVEQLQQAVEEASRESSRFQKDYEESLESVRQLEALVAQSNERGDHDRTAWEAEADSLRSEIEKLSDDLQRTGDELDELRQSNQDLTTRLEEVSRQRDEALETASQLPSQEDLLAMQRQRDDAIESMMARPTQDELDAVSLQRDEAVQAIEMRPTREEFDQLSDQLRLAQAKLEQMDQQIASGDSLSPSEGVDQVPSPFESAVPSESGVLESAVGEVSAGIDSVQQQWEQAADDADQAVDISNANIDESSLQQSASGDGPSGEVALSDADESAGVSIWKSSTEVAPEQSANQPAAIEEPDDQVWPTYEVATDPSDEVSAPEADSQLDYDPQALDPQTDDDAEPLGDAHSVWGTAAEDQTDSDEHESDPALTAVDHETGDLTVWSHDESTQLLSDSSVIVPPAESSDVHPVQSADDESPNAEISPDESIAEGSLASLLINDLNEEEKAEGHPVESASIDGHDDNNGSSEEAAGRDHDDADTFASQTYHWDREKEIDPSEAFTDNPWGSLDQSDEDESGIADSDAALTQDENVSGFSDQYSGQENSDQRDIESPSFLSGSPLVSDSSYADQDDASGSADEESSFLSAFGDSHSSDDESQPPEDDATSLLDRSAVGGSTDQELASQSDDPLSAGEDQVANDFSMVSETPSDASTVEINGDEDDDSIEAYMNRLLRRVQGEPGDDSVDQTESISLSTSSSSSLDTDSATDEAPAEAESSVVAPEPIDPNTPLVPRSQAPERHSNLSAMRELANQSARNAIHRSSEIKNRNIQLAGLMNFGVAAIALLLCLGSSFIVTGGLLLVIMVMALVVAGICVQDGMRNLAEAKAGRKTAARADQELANEIEPAAENVSQDNK